MVLDSSPSVYSTGVNYLKTMPYFLHCRIQKHFRIPVRISRWPFSLKKILSDLLSYLGTVALLPLKQRKLLRWKMSSVTPNVVRHTIARSHFKVTKSKSISVICSLQLLFWMCMLVFVYNCSCFQCTWVYCKRLYFIWIPGNHDWLGCWGHHMKSPGFKAIREYQKVHCLLNA